ncbi:hypothetical protein [Streptomyces sediminimaris]|uniref:hypothetical protein n=1 Tax=Streptomyces sediminimaris TaxID=3383721 RepID=UPI00399A4482
MDSSQPVCPVCGQPVETVIRRYKTLGAWVPRWVAGPCRDPGCGARVSDGEQAGETGEADETGEDPGRTAPPRP